MENKISKLGLWLAIINVVLSILFCYAGAGNGFGMIPIMIIDFPATLIALSFGGMLLMKYTSNNAMPQFIVFSVLFSIFGGLQWYFIGWLISRLKNIIFKKKAV